MLIEGATVDLELENRRLRAELHAQTQELRGSRARLVAAGDAERRRLERDLHDGAQGRFAAVALHLRLAQSKAPPDSELASMLETAIGELYSGLEELRELARGIHPAVLTQRGLEPALESLAGRAPLPVDVSDDGRGGASPDGGSGLRGLADRVGALDGRLEIESPAGAGTRVHVEIPLRPAISSPGRRFVRGA
jgi:signal transduction histidine kinase